MVSKKHSSPAFTIVELLVVIVVIGILAAITIVSYTGITSRATASALQSDLTNASSQLKLYQIDHSAYPTSLNASNCPLDSSGVVDSTYCIKPTSGNTFLYSSNNNSNPQTFSLYAINTSTSTKYRTTDSSSPTVAAPVVATGGTITNVGGYRIHTFTTSGTFTVTSGDNVEVLVVGGGGGGGTNMGGGGGGGGVIYDSSYAVTPQAYNVIVGAGGNGAPAGTTGGHPTVTGTNGGNSMFSNLIAIGGGWGGVSFNDMGLGINFGNSGGSGGGSSGYNNNGVTPGYYGSGGGTSGQGYRGGYQGNAYYSGGGGGAGGAGADGNVQANGGLGVANSILGTSYHWGGGGGGAGYSICGGNGGNGGGGGGAVCTTTGGSGLNNGSAGGGGSVYSQTNTPGGDAGANTGGGGGGGSHYDANNKGGNGGSGIVIIRYPN